MEGDLSAVLVGGRTLPQRYAVAELGLLTNGTAIADAGTSPGGIVAPWRLWQLVGPLTLVGRTSGIQANGDIYRNATVHAFSCPGALHLTLLAKQDEQISLIRQGHLYRRLNVKLGGQPLKVLRLVVPAEPSVQGPCDHSIESTGLLGSTVVELVPAGG